MVYLSRVLITRYIGCIKGLLLFCYPYLGFLGILAPLLLNLSISWRIKLPFTGVQQLTKWSPRYQLMHQCCGTIYSLGALSIHVPCMQSTLGNPNSNGP